MDLPPGGEGPGRGSIVLRRYETTQDVPTPERVTETDRERETALFSFLLSLDVRPVGMKLAVRSGEQISNPSGPGRSHRRERVK